MANFETIKTTIDANINTNGNQAITGAVMNSVLKQMVDSTDTELTKLSEEITYKTPLDGVVFGNLAGDVVLQKTLRSIWVEKLDESFEFQEKYAFTLLVNSDAKTPSFSVQISRTDINSVAFLFSSETKGTGLTEITCEGYSTHKGRANIHLVFDFDRYQDNISYGTPSMETHVVMAGLNTSPLDGNLYLKYAIDKLEQANSTINEEIANISAYIGEVPIEVYGGEGTIRVELSLEEDKYYNTDHSDGYMKENPSNYADSGYYCAKMQVSEGNTYRLYGLGGSGSTRLFAFADENLFRISRSDNNIDARSNGIEIDVPQGAKWLYINFKSYDKTIDKLTTKGNIVGLRDRVAVLENNVSPLMGKTLVCFGDSLTANKDSNGKSWTDYAAEYVGANFINVAVGGSQLKMRVNVEIFNSAHAYNKITDFVYHRDSDGIMRCYQCIATHSGEWDSSHFSLTTNSNMYAGLDISSLITQSCTGDFSIAAAASECIQNQFGSDFSALITKLQSIDWEKVDAIVVWGGTNDFNSTDTKRYGVIGEIDKSTTFGAINYIAETFCSTYKSIPLYYISLIPHWTDFKNGVGSPDKWGDVEYKYPIFDAAKTYAVNDKVVYVTNGIARVYQCTAVHSGEWIESDFKDIGPAYTFKDFSALLCQEFASNHIPYKDLYNTLSWNKYNFAEYYPDNDGTHPMKGLRKISHAIASFINSCVNL